MESNKLSKRAKKICKLFENFQELGDELNKCEKQIDDFFETAKNLPTYNDEHVDLSHYVVDYPFTLTPSPNPGMNVENPIKLEM